MCHAICAGGFESLWSVCGRCLAAPTRATRARTAVWASAACPARRTTCWAPWITWILVACREIEHEALSTYTSMSKRVTFVFFCSVFRWFGWRLLDDLAGVNARAAHVRGRGANPLHPRGSGFRPPDGHGDRSLWVAHGQRQPAHLAIGETPPEIRWDIESLSRKWDFWRDFFCFRNGTEQHYWEGALLLRDGYLTNIHSLRNKSLNLADAGKPLAFSFYGASIF